ncbi:MAG: putative sugar nucleotidyl transferase [Candidatus Neomarinimicrobiota bacterium]
MIIYIFEDRFAVDFEPLTQTRPAFDLRCGAFTFLERLRKMVPDGEIRLVVRLLLVDTVAETHPDFSVNPAVAEDGLWLLGNVYWDDKTLAELLIAPPGLFYSAEIPVAARLTAEEGQEWLNSGGPVVNACQATIPRHNLSVQVARRLWDINQALPATLVDDQRWFPAGVPNAADYPGVYLIKRENIFIGRDVMISPMVFIDATVGPVLISENVTVDPFVVITGPVYIGPGCHLSPHTVLRNGCAIGPVCNLGGEIKGTVIQGYSNKSHYGFLGDSYLGEWVNLGAGTTNSNLKNNYGNVSVMVNGRAIDSGLVHAGVYLGDHVKTGINTPLNSGTIIGTGSSVVSGFFPPRLIPPFTFLVNEKASCYSYAKFIATARIVMGRRNWTLSPATDRLLSAIYADSEKYYSRD